MRVLVVDDSVSFRSAIKAALKDVPNIEVAGTAANGKIAIAKLESDTFDVMILDLEMPELDGLQTLAEIRRLGIKIKTLVFAAPTEAAYLKVREALALGASDFIAKPITQEANGINSAIEKIRSEIIPRLQALNLQNTPTSVSSPPLAPLVSKVEGNRWSRREVYGFLPRALVIASSTGGPMALERVFGSFIAPVTIPIYVIQHMPKPFTKGLASRLSEISGLDVREGEHGELVKAGRVYVAPAEYHMRIVKSDSGLKIELFQGARINYVMPAADPLFESVADIYGSSLAGVVLTGMGEDGKRGAIAIKDKGGVVLIQDEKTSVVWGMPGAVHQAGAFDHIAPIDECATICRSWLQIALR